MQWPEQQQQQDMSMKIKETMNNFCFGNIDNAKIRKLIVNEQKRNIWTKSDIYTKWRVDQVKHV